MESAVGGPFLREVRGVLAPVGTPNSVVSCVRGPSLSSEPLPGLVPFCRASMISRCWSRTSRLRCSCSRMPGLLVAKPGERQARPTSWMAKPADSREVKGAEGRPVFGPPRLLDMLEERSSRLGRGRDDGRAGEPGSLFTLTAGGAPPLRCTLWLWLLLLLMLPLALAGELLLFSGLLLSRPAVAPPSGVPLLRFRLAAGSCIGPFEGGAEADMGTLVGAIDCGVKWAGNVDVGAATAVDILLQGGRNTTEVCGKL